MLAVMLQSVLYDGVMLPLGDRTTRIASNLFENKISHALFGAASDLTSI
jgi:hypothetical protein